MRFIETILPGVYVIELQPHTDERGFFARTFCRREFQRKGLDSDFVQCNISFNEKSGTLRGMHYQAPPHAEAKLVRCTAGALFDVIVDLRPQSPTHLKWIGVPLDAGNRRMVYLPKGFAHGFQTLADNTEITYQISSFYHPDSQRGFRYDDPDIGIKWPMEVSVMSERDANLPRHLAETDGSSGG